MSMRALVLAAVARLQAANSWTSSTCEASIDGAPPPMAGELFAAVRPGLWICNRDDGGLDEEFGFDVVITRRLGFAPTDRQDSDVMTTSGATGIMTVAETVRAQLHMSYTVIDTANTTIGGSADGFIEPVRFLSATPPRVVGADWFSSDQDDFQAGLMQTLTFGGARRVQTIESQT